VEKKDSRPFRCRRLPWRGVFSRSGPPAPSHSLRHHRLYRAEDRQKGDGSRTTRRAVLLRPIPQISIGPQHANPGRSYRSAFQFQRKAIGENSLVTGGVWQAGRTGIVDSRNHAGNSSEMIGTTRSRVNFFMNRFRKLGFIEYNGRIRVHRSLLNVILHD
jgi:hypothetical protein